MSQFIDIIHKMIDTVLAGGLSVGFGGLPLSQAISMVLITYAPHFVAFCLLVGLTYFAIHKMKKR